MDIVQTWGGVSGAAKLFIEKRYGHVLRGEGGQRASSKVVFCKKVCFGVPEELLYVKIIYKPKIKIKKRKREIKIKKKEKNKQKKQKKKRFESKVFPS